MCYGSFDVGYFQAKLAERERPAAAPPARQPTVATSRTARAVDIRTPLGMITFYVRRQPVREQDNAPAVRLRREIDDLVARGDGGSSIAPVRRLAFAA